MRLRSLLCCFGDGQTVADEPGLLRGWAPLPSDEGAHRQGARRWWQGGRSGGGRRSRAPAFGEGALREDEWGPQYGSNYRKYSGECQWRCCGGRAPSPPSPPPGLRRPLVLLAAPDCTHCHLTRRHLSVPVQPISRRDAHASSSTCTCCRSCAVRPDISCHRRSGGRGLGGQAGAGQGRCGRLWRRKQEGPRQQRQPAARCQAAARASLRAGRSAEVALRRKCLLASSWRGYFIGGRCSACLHASRACLPGPPL